MRLVPSCHYLVFGVSGEMAAGEELFFCYCFFMWVLREMLFTASFFLGTCYVFLEMRFLRIGSFRFAGFFSVMVARASQEMARRRRQGVEASFHVRIGD